MGGADVLHGAGIRDLPFAAIAAQLADAFGDDAPALHVAVREMPAGGIGRPAPGAQSQRAVLHELAALALLAEAEALQAEHHRRREIVVDAEALDVIAAEAGAVIDAAAGREAGVPVIVGRGAAIGEAILPGIAGEQHWRALQV